MDINSIGSTARLTGISPATAHPYQGSNQAIARENLAATDATPNATQTTAAKPGDAANLATREETEQAQRQKLQEGVDALNEFIKPQNTTLQFSIDDESDTVVVKVTDKETKEVIKQFPSEEALELAKALDKLKGLLVQQEV